MAGRTLHRSTHAILTGVFARLPHDFDNFRIEIGRMVVAGDTVLVEARYRAIARATGKPLDSQVAHVWDLRNGKTFASSSMPTPGSSRR